MKIHVPCVGDAILGPIEIHVPFVVDAILGPIEIHVPCRGCTLFDTPITLLAMVFPVQGVCF